MPKSKQLMTISIERMTRVLQKKIKLNVYNRDAI